MTRRIVDNLSKICLGGATGICVALSYSSKSSDPPTSRRFPAKFIQSVLAVTPVLLRETYKSVSTPWDYNWDGRNSSKTHHTSSFLSLTDASGDKCPQASKYNRHLLLVRHGQYHYGRDDADCHLTSLGQQQTDLTGQRLRQLSYPYSRIVYSTMTRAVESAEEIIKYLPGVPTVPCDSLREGAPFPPEPPVPNWPESPEAYFEDGPRIEAAFSKYVHRADPEQKCDSYEILICHANVIRYFACRALQLPPEAWIRMSLDNGSITWLTIRPSGNVSLRWLGNSGYMPPDKISIQ